MILSHRINDDDHRDGFTKWPFMTTHTWGEYPQGTWLLEVNSRVPTRITFVTSFLFCIRGNTIRFEHRALLGKLQHSNTSTWMAERMDADASRYQGTTIHGTIDGRSSLQTSDCQEGPRGATQCDLTISMTTVHAIIADFSEENRNIPIGRCLRERSLSAFLILRAAGKILIFFFSDLVARRSHHPCQSIIIRYSHVLDYIRIRVIAEKSIPVLFILVVRLPYHFINMSTIITYHAVYNKACIVKNVSFIQFSVLQLVF